MMMHPQQNHLLDMNTMSSAGGAPAYLAPKSPGAPPTAPPQPWGLHLSDLEKAYSNHSSFSSHFHHHAQQPLAHHLHSPHEEPPPPPNSGEYPPPVGPEEPNGPPAPPQTSSGPSVASKKSQSRRNAWGNLSYADLITQAINSAPEKRLTLSQVYEWMVQNIPYFKDKGDSNSSAGWKNSIRHNLSLHNRFIRVQNEGTGKSSWWMINPDAKHSGGKSSRRRAASSTALVDGKPVESTSKRRGRKQKAGFVSDLLSARNVSTPSSPAVDIYGGANTGNGPPESPGYQYSSPFGSVAATDLRTGRTEYAPAEVRHDAPYPPYNEWSPEYAAVASGGYFGNNLARGSYVEGPPPGGIEREIPPPRNLSPLRSNGFPYREGGGFSNGTNENNFSIKNFFEKDSSPLHIHSLHAQEPGATQGYSNLQVMSPSLEHHHHPPSSPGIVNSRHQFSSSTTSSNPPSVDINPHQGGEPLLSPQAANMAYYSQTHQPQSSSNNNNSNTHASPESPVVRAPSTGSSSASGSILERALASSVKSEANPGSPHPEWARSTGGAPPGSNYGSGEVVEEYMKSEYASSSGGGGEYPGYPPPPTPDGESPPTSTSSPGGHLPASSSYPPPPPVTVNPSWVR